MGIRADQGLAGLLAAGLALGAVQARADDDKYDLYFGAGGDQASVQDRIGFGEAGQGNFNVHTTGKMGLAGFMFLPWLGIEAEYHDLNSKDDRFNNAGVKVNLDDATVWTGSLIGKLPVGPVDLFAKIGGASHDAHVSVHALANGAKLGNANDNGQEYAAGGGIEANIQNVSIRGEYQYIDAADGVWIATLAAIWHVRWGGSHAVAAAPPPAPAPAPAPAVAAAPAAPVKCPDADRDGVCDADDACPNTPPGKRVDTAGCDCDYTLQTHFATNSAELTAADKASLDQLADTLNSQKLKFVSGEIDGYTDSTGSDAYNLGLSKRRADAVAQYLNGKGVTTGQRFGTRGYGEASPIADNGTADGRAQNRRVVIRRTDCGPAG